MAVLGINNPTPEPLSRLYGLARGLKREFPAVGLLNPQEIVTQNRSQALICSLFRQKWVFHAGWGQDWTEWETDKSASG